MDNIALLMTAIWITTLISISISAKRTRREISSLKSALIDLQIIYNQQIEHLALNKSD